MDSGFSEGLLKALQDVGSAQLTSLGQNRRMAYAQINNNANASGLLYSTKPAFQQAQYFASENLPAVTEVQSEQLTKTMQAKELIQQQQQQLAALNAAAAKLTAAAAAAGGTT